jgi:hypothetical protein
MVALSSLTHDARPPPPPPHARTHLRRLCTVQVVSIRRYFATKGFTAFTNIDLSAEPDRPALYDVVLSDGTYTQKCLLAPRLNSMVFKGELTECSFVRVTQCVTPPQRALTYHENAMLPRGSLL